MTERESGLRSYVMDHPDLNDYARFRAAGERFGLDFHRWPSTARSGLLRGMMSIQSWFATTCSPNGSSMSR